MTDADGSSLLPELRQALIQAALAARAKAYAPYSKYHVGAAVWTDQEQLVHGANVENASYGGTLCAERVAAAYAVAQGARRLRAIAIATPGAAAPCGLCRQFLSEFGLPMEVLLVDSDTGLLASRYTLAELLPAAFSLAAVDTSQSGHGSPRS